MTNERMLEFLVMDTWLDRVCHSKEYDISKFLTRYVELQKEFFTPYAK